MAPEALNNDWRAPDKVDLFALGASLYELATGQDLPTGLCFTASRMWME